MLTTSSPPFREGCPESCTRGFGKYVVVRLLILLRFELCISLIGICRKDDIEFKQYKQFSAAIDNDAR